MKSPGFQTTGFALVGALAVIFSTANVFSQTVPAPTPMFHDITNPDNTVSTPATPATPYPSTPVEPNPATHPEETTPAPVSTTPTLPYGVPEVLQLSQAKISDTTIISYIQNSGTIYPLNASQIIYLKQQGVSEPVIDAMLNQRAMMAAQATQTPQPQNGATQPNATIAQPSTPAPDESGTYGSSGQSYSYSSGAYPYYYSYPYYYYYPYYSYYPSSYWWWGSPTVSWWWPTTWWWGWGFPVNRGFYSPHSVFVFHGGSFHGSGFFVPPGGSSFHGGTWGGGGWGGGGTWHGGGGWSGGGGGMHGGMGGGGGFHH